MRKTASKGTPARQRGIALLILLAIISMAVIFALVSGLNKSANDLARARDLKTYAALAQAKAALINYAVTYKDTHDNPGGNSYTVPGYLPCPDLGSGTEGVAAGSCGASLVSAIGKLPWRTLGLDALKDGSGECLWYAVSGTYKNSPNGLTSTNTTNTSNMMNWDTNGQFDVMDANGTSFLTGATSDTNAVAVIFAPGAALSGQNHAPAAGTTNCGGNYTPAAYLDTANGINNSTLITPSSPNPLVTDTSTFIAGTASDTFNDKLVYITRADIWNAIKKRTDFNNYLRAMTRLSAECVAQYGNNNKNGTNELPWASNVSLSGTSVPTYAVNASYNDVSTGMYGRLSFKVDTSRGNTNNKIANNIFDYGTNGAYLFTNGSYCSYTNDQKVWYDNWKDQLFYAVATSFKPGATWQWWYPFACPSCLTVNNSGSYAAVVIFAGDKLTNAAGQVTQPRNTAGNKGTIANYLDGSNTVANTGTSNYQALPTSSTFNDIVYAIDSTLTVNCLSASSGAMTTVPGAAVAPPGTGNPGAYYTDLANYAACP